MLAGANDDGQALEAGNRGEIGGRADDDGDLVARSGEEGDARAGNFEPARGRIGDRDGEFVHDGAAILVISEDLDELRNVLKGLVESNDALSVGEDFLLLSSAKFEANRIEVTERVGLDLILPLAAMLPFERHIRWVEEMRLGAIGLQRAEVADAAS